MKVFIASEFRCTIYNGEYYLAPKAYAIYKRYADAFGDIVLCSRFDKPKSLMQGYQKADFIKCSVDIENLSKALFGRYNTIITEKMRECDLVIVRVPSIIAYRGADCAKKLRKPYLAESMGDAWDSYWNHGLFGKLIAPYMYFKMKSVVKHADFALYVTERYLQKRYPCNNKSINASNVVINDLDPVILENRIKKISNMESKRVSLMTAAAVNTQAKGHEYVIRAMKLLRKKGYTVKYYLAGGGDPERLQRIAKECDVLDDVIFLGELPMNEVYKYLDKIDIYIQPSLQEGLPRAVIEAMSRACPCLGSNTAGTPELLDKECIFKRKSVDAIVSSIEWLTNQELTHFAERNFVHAALYADSALRTRRNSYFQYVKDSITMKANR